MYRILIVEDEPEAAERLRAAIARYGQEHNQQFNVVWARSALELDEKDPEYDLIFMDIELPGQNGMDAALELRGHDHATPLIFVTNLAQYAVRGYEAEALDFIVKPFTYGAFALRMDRAMQVMRRSVGRTIAVRSRDGSRIFPASSLVSVEVRGHDLAYALDDGTSFSARGSLSAVERELGGSPFLRVSSGCIINMGYVRGVHDAEITLSNGATAWVSRANKRRCLEEIARYLGGGA